MPLAANESGFSEAEGWFGESGESLVDPRGMIRTVAAVRRIRAVRHSMLLRQCSEKLRGRRRGCRPAIAEAASLTRSVLLRICTSKFSV